MEEEKVGTKPTPDGLALLYWIVIIGGVIFLIMFLMILFLLLPMCFAIIGFFYEKVNRMWWGILSVISFIYLWIDLSNKWLSHLIIYGDQKENSLMLKNGLFDGKIQEFLNYFYILNIISVVIGIVLIYQSLKEKKIN
jgi:lysylphosphatidylglycerol synthetase-like protein (DUF2156 family)